MRLLTLSLAGALVIALAAARAQSSASSSSPSSSSDVTQLPVGQVYKDFAYPYWENGQLKFTMSATEATGITINRAETSNLKIDLYTDGKVTTTITSPDADIYVADRKMRTHHTVKIDRADLTATAQFCDFDLAEKQYTLRDHVKVTLLHFDMKAATPAQANGPMGVPRRAGESPFETGRPGTGDRFRLAAGLTRLVFQRHQHRPAFPVIAPMKFPLLLAVLLLAAASCAHAQTPATDTDSGALPVPAPDSDVAAETPAAGQTVITSDELQMDEVTHIAVFTGNVETVGTNFNMKCQEMTVNFDKAGKIDNIVAKGNVVIVQPGRITHCGQAIYYHDEDKFVLTDQPIINDNGKTIAAPKITIYRTRQSLYTEGKSRVTIPKGSALSNPSASSPK